MTSDECRLLLPEYLAGQLDGAEREQFEAQLSASAELRQELEELRSTWEGLAQLAGDQPSAALRARFYQKLNALEKQGQHSIPARWGRWRLSPWAQLAMAAALFLLGLYIGRGGIEPGVRATEVAQMRLQVQQLREAIALSLLDRQSATARLEGVAWSSRVERPDSDLLSALVGALNHDPNVNVRLSSLDALEKFSGDIAVRKALVDSIPRQESPLMQIALIDALVQIRDHAAGTELRRLTGDAETEAVVRQRARWGLEKLGFQ